MSLWGEHEVNWGKYTVWNWIWDTVKGLGIVALFVSVLAGIFKLVQLTGFFLTKWLELPVGERIFASQMLYGFLFYLSLYILIMVIIGMNSIGRGLE